MNISLISLSLSFISRSPYMMISSCKETFHLSIQKSSLFRFTNSYLQTFTTNHKTEIQNTFFHNFISTPIVFVSSEATTNSNCYIGDNKQWENKPIKNVNLTFNDFQNIQNNHRPRFISNCGDLIIAGCTFLNLQSWQYGKYSGGGAILVEQLCTVMIHECIFNNCQSNNHGGAILICAKRNFPIDIPIFDLSEADAFKDDEIVQLNTQFCCFQDCYIFSESDKGTINEKHGSAMYIAAKKTNISFLSTVRCPGHNRCTHRGAQFDIQSTMNIYSSNINTTGGKSTYCSGIEYRRSQNGVFQFQTVTNMIGKFATSLTSLKTSVIVSYCNYVNNTVQYINDKDADYSALIHIRYDSTEINNFCFVQTNYEGDKNKCKLVASDYNNNQHKYLAVINNCYSDESDRSKYIAKTINNLTFYEEGNAFTNTIEQLFLGECIGVKKAEQIIISDMFTPSDYFTNSNVFTNSDMFTKTNSDEFSLSKVFSDSIMPQLPQNQGGGDDKTNKGKVIGIAVGCAVAALAAVAVVAVFFIRRNRLKVLTSDIDAIETLDSAITTNNKLGDIMDKDDPFNDEFK